MVVTTLALPVTLMPVLLWLLDLAGALDLGARFLRFAVYIVAPFAIAVAAQFSSGVRRGYSTSRPQPADGSSRCGSNRGARPGKSGAAGDYRVDWRG